MWFGAGRFFDSLAAITSISRQVISAKSADGMSGQLSKNFDAVSIGHAANLICAGQQFLIQRHGIVDSQVHEFTNVLVEAAG